MDTKDKMLIMGHKIGDTDSFGAAIGIWRIATSLIKGADRHQWGQFFRETDDGAV